MTADARPSAQAWKAPGRSEIAGLGPGLAVVAGGAGILGDALVARLVAAGHPVIVLDRRAGSDTDRVTHMSLDLTDEPAVLAAITEIAVRYGAPEILVNCQGWSPKGPGGTPLIDAQLPADAFLDIVNVNLVSCYVTMRAVVPLMAAAGRGRVVNVTSTAARTGRTPASPGYVAAKAALEALTRCFAVRYGGAGVLVSAVAPGKIDGSGWPDEPGRLDRYRCEIPLGRLATPAEIAGVIMFLTSADNTYLTGHTVTVDGGRLA